MQVVIGKKKKKKERNKRKTITESHSGRTIYNKQIAVKSSWNVYCDYNIQWLSELHIHTDLHNMTTEQSAVEKYICIYI